MDTETMRMLGILSMGMSVVSAIMIIGMSYGNILIQLLAGFCFIGGAIAGILQADVYKKLIEENDSK